VAPLARDGAGCDAAVREGLGLTIDDDLTATVSYRLRATFRRRLGAYLSLGVLIALLGGVGFAAIAAARRTQSSYPKLLAGTHASDLVVSSFGANTTPSSSNAPNTLSEESLRRLPGVVAVRSVVVLNTAPLLPNGAPNMAGFANIAAVGSVDGLLFDQDRLAVLHGRLADPTRIDEFMITADGARQMGLHLGQTVSFGEYTNAQTSLPGFGTAAVAPSARRTATLVGIVEVNNQIIQDDVDRYPTFAFFTPAFTKPFIPDVTATLFGLRLAHGARDVPAVEREFVHNLRAGSTYEFHETSVIEGRVERAVKPETIALAVFGVIAVVATIVVASLTISRMLHALDSDALVLRALGSTPRAIAADGLFGIAGAVIAGTVAAGLVAVALSPEAPLGPVRPVYPGRGVALDWTVLGLGVAFLGGVLVALAGALAYRRAPHRMARRATLVHRRDSVVASAAADAGLPAPAVVGVRFALDPGRGSATVPVRSALAGAVLAVLTVVATITFGSGLHTLFTTPRLYGWNWDYALSPSQNVPHQTLAAMDRDPNIAAWSASDEVIFQLDGRNVPGLIGQQWDRLSPPILSGHTVEGADQILLGSATLAQLHKHVGETVTLSYGTPQDAPVYIPPTVLRIVGTATMPALGFTSFVADHTSMGTGAIVSNAVMPPAMVAASLNPDANLNGPNLVLVRLRAGISEAAGRADVQRLADGANGVFAADPNATGASVALLGVQRPAEIVNYRTMGDTPIILAGGLAAGAVLALALTLVASVRRRVRDLAILKTLGFTRRQLSAAVAWQATVAAVTGLVFGLPLGIAAGRQLWILFARDIYAVPEPTVPVSTLILVGAAALIIANVVAALPGWLAGRTPTALVLRAE
jgi:hypothetical protein